jgi:hypothetical protein
VVSETDRKMFVLKLFVIALPFQIVLTLTGVEDKYLTNQLLEYFDDDSSEVKSDVIAASNQKRFSDLTADNQERFASLFSPFNISRANHYWTRKRGRDQTTQHPQMIWEIYYTLYPTRVSRFNYGTGDSMSRKKRETMKKFLRLNKISSRVKRDVGKDDEAIEKSGKDEVEGVGGNSSVGELLRNRTRPGGRWGNFGRKL